MDVLGSMIGTLLNYLKTKTKKKQGKNVDQADNSANIFGVTHMAPRTNSRGSHLWA